MSKTITANIPESIHREDYTAMLRHYGFEPDDLIALRFEVGGIYAEVMARDESGHLMQGEAGAVATHTIFVPLED